MASVKVPTTVAELLTTAGQATGNIARHREAMAAVAAQAAAKTPQPVPAGGETQ